MSVVGEIALVAGLTAAVAAVITAYRDGGSILDGLKKRRTQKGALPPPTHLVHSVHQTPDDIQREKERGVQRFGPRFLEGDAIAVVNIQQIALMIQHSFLQKLCMATENDNYTDFGTLLNDAEDGRDSTIRALMDLQQRLRLTETIPTLPSLVPQSSRARIEPTRSGISQVLTISPVPDTPDLEHTLAPRQRSSLLFKLRRQNKSRGGSHDLSSKGGRDAFRRVQTLPPDVEEVTNSPTQELAHNDNMQTSHTYQEWEDDPAKNPWRSSYVEPTVTLPPPTRSSTSSTSRSGSTTLPHPTPQNNYLGFCKGAYMLQCDLDATTEYRDYTYSAQSNVRFLRCTHCKFEGHFSPDTIWNTIFTFKDLGIAARWSFLAKSHVKQKQTLDRPSAKQCKFSYKCRFCVFYGHESPVFLGPKSLLEHISQCHRGGAMNDLLLSNTGCITDRIGQSDDEFDINIFPTLYDSDQSTLASLAPSSVAVSV